MGIRQSISLLLCSGSSREWRVYKNIRNWNSLGLVFSLSLPHSPLPLILDIDDECPCVGDWIHAYENSRRSFNSSSIRRFDCETVQDLDGPETVRSYEIVDRHTLSSYIAFGKNTRLILFINEIRKRRFLLASDLDRDEEGSAE